MMGKRAPWTNHQVPEPSLRGGIGEGFSPEDRGRGYELRGTLLIYSTRPEA